MLPSKGDVSASRWARPSYHTTSKNIYTTSTPISTPRPQPLLHRTPSPSQQSHQTRPKSRSPTRNSSPKRTNTTLPPNSTTPSQHLQHLNLLLPRLKWRASLLLSSLSYATHPDQHGIGLTPLQADVQFRIDFFEFYVLLERVLLQLLSAVGVRVSRAYQPDAPSRNRSPERKPFSNVINGNGNGKSSAALIGDAKNIAARSGHGHAFHANLLSALTQKHNNPLYHLLGTGAAHSYIALAKDLRNGWKESAVEDITPDSSSSQRNNPDQQQMHGHHPRSRSQSPTKLNNPEGGQIPDDTARLNRLLKRRYADLLVELKLDEMLRVILVAVEEAGVIARREVERVAASAAKNEGGVSAVKPMKGNGHAHAHMRGDSVEMVDAMFDDGEVGPLESRGVGSTYGYAGEDYEMEF